MLFQLAVKTPFITFEEPNFIISKPAGKAPSLQVAMTEVYNDVVEYGKVYSFQLNLNGTPATLKLDFSKTGGKIVVGTQYDLGKIGQTERGESEPLGKNWKLTGQFTLTDSDGKSTTYETHRITAIDPDTGKVKIELNSGLVTGVADSAMLGIAMAPVTFPNFIGNVNVALPQGVEAKIEMYDLSGSLVVSQKVQPGTSTVNLNLNQNNIAGGAYILRLNIDGARFLATKVYVP